mgnify:CR=1 FL=1
MRRLGRSFTIGLMGLGWAILWGIQPLELAWAQGSGGASAFQSYSKVMPLPDFTLDDLVGKTTPIKDYRGKMILLNFWATW